MTEPMTFLLELRLSPESFETILEELITSLYLHRPVATA